MEWLKELHTNVGMIMTAASVVINLGVAIFAVRNSITSRKKTRVELEEHESRIVRPTPQEIGKFGRSLPDSARKNSLIRPTAEKPAPSVTERGEQWLEEEYKLLSLNEVLSRELVLQRARSFRRRRGNDLDFRVVLHGLIVSAFLGTSGLLYVYLKNQTYKTRIEIGLLNGQLHTLTAENSILKQRARVLMAPMKNLSISDVEKARLEERLKDYNKKSDSHSANSSPNP